MFKKLYKKINDAKNSCIYEICEKHVELRKFILESFLKFEKSETRVERMQDTISSQQHTIELLTNALQDKYKNGLLVVNDKNNMDIPLVVKDGKVLTDGKIKSVSIYWEVGEAPSIEICQ